MKAPIEQELLPCPFCGNEAHFRTNINGRSEAHCSDILCIGFISLNYGDIIEKKDAIEAWNTRATPKPSGEVNLSLTAERFALLVGSIEYAKAYGGPSKYTKRQDLLNDIRSQTKGVGE